MATERVERRLAAILAADVAGYSRLMGADEEGTLARLKALRRELAARSRLGRSATTGSVWTGGAMIQRRTAARASI